MATAPARRDYWVASHTVATRTGWCCRECKPVITKGEPIVVRDGRRIRFFYHERCFSGIADPRSQPHSSFASGRWDLPDTAPPWRPRKR